MTLNQFRLRNCTKAFSLACLFLSLANRAFGDNVESPYAGLLNKAIGEVNNANILAYLKRETCPDPDPIVIGRLISLLDNNEYAKREEGSSALSKQPLTSIPLLDSALVSGSAECRQRVALCIDKIRKTWSYERIATFRAATYEVMRRRPEGITECLMQLLPMLADDELESDVQFAIDDAVGRKQRVESMIEKYQTDQFPIRRSIASFLMARRGTPKQQEKARNSLQDTSPLVRLRTAQGFLAFGDKSVVSNLVDLLRERPVFISWQAEELLHWVVQDDLPFKMPMIGGGKRANECRAEWEAWWEENKDAVDLQKTIATKTHPTLLFVDNLKNTDQTASFLVGCDGKARWRLPRIKRATGSRTRPARLDQFFGEDCYLLRSCQDSISRLRKGDGLGEMDLCKCEISSKNVRRIASWRVGPQYECECIDGWRLFANQIVLIAEQKRLILAPNRQPTPDRNTPGSKPIEPGKILVFDEQPGDSQPVRVEFYPKHDVGSQRWPLRSGNFLEKMPGETGPQNWHFRERDSDGNVIWTFESGLSFVTRFPDGDYLAVDSATDGPILEMDRSQAICQRWRVNGLVHPDVRSVFSCVRLGFTR